MDEQQDKNVIDFSALKSKLAKSKIVSPVDNTTEPHLPSNEDLIYQGLDDFFSHLEQGVTGFITIAFNDIEKVRPEVVIAGEIDMLKAIGSLHHLSNSFSNSMYVEEMINDTEPVSSAVLEDVQDEEGITPKDED